MRFTEFFWDFDGTLYDTYPRVTRAFQKALAERGIDAPYGEILPYAKRSLIVASEHFGAPHGVRAEELMAGYRRHADAEGRESMRPYPGAAGMLRAVVRAGGRNYLYTHRDDLAARVLGEDGLADCFADFITSQSPDFACKPAPDALLALIGRHALDRARCVMVGDRDIDIESGVNAGIAGALFDPDGFYDGYPVDLRFRSMADMRRALLPNG